MMANFKKIKLNKVKNLLYGFMRSLAEHGFFTFLVLFAVSLGLGILIFFRFSVMVDSPAQKDDSKKPFQFEEKAYQSIKDEWEKKKGVFSQTELKKYSNPFLH
jgi:uncharacterized membrane protein